MNVAEGILDIESKEFVKCSKCNGTGKGEGCIEQGGFVMGLCPECCGHTGYYKEKKMEQTIDKRTKEYRDSVKPEIEPGHFEKAANNPGWKLCMYCGAQLPPNEDGTPKWRKFPEACSDCIWRNA